MIYLDTDTMVMQPLDVLWRDRPDTDLIARPATVYGRQDWDQEAWLEVLHHVGSAEIPYFNAGFLIFQNRAHQKLNPEWFNRTQRILAGELVKLEPKKIKFADQYALALSAGAAQLRYHVLDRTGQGYGWLEEPFDDTVLYHTGGYQFWRFAEQLELVLNIADLDLPRFKGINLLNPVWIKRQLRHNSLYQVLKQVRTWAKAG